MRLRLRFALLLVAAAAPARAQQTNVPPAPPELPAKPPQKPSRYQSLVRGHKPSPEWTQERAFTSTRFWLIDPGEMAVETWFDTRVFHETADATGAAVRAPSELLLQQELEVGLLPHLQLDLYENVSFNVGDDGNRGVQQEGVQIEARVAIPSYYNQIPTNPVVYLEFHPRHNEPDRAEIRLLLGQAFFGDRLYVAANPYFETNVEDTVSPYVDPQGQLGTTTRFIMDAEVGTTLAVGVKVNDWLNLSAEGKIGGDMLGDPNNDFHFVAWAGPGFLIRPLPGRIKKHLRIMGTILFDVVPRDARDPFQPQLVEPTFIVASTL